MKKFHYKRFALITNRWIPLAKKIHLISNELALFYFSFWMFIQLDIINWKIPIANGQLN